VAVAPFANPSLAPTRAGGDRCYVYLLPLPLWRLGLLLCSISAERNSAPTAIFPSSDLSAGLHPRSGFGAVHLPICAPIHYHVYRGHQPDNSRQRLSLFHRLILLRAISGRCRTCRACRPPAANATRHYTSCAAHCVNVSAAARTGWRAACPTGIPHPPTQLLSCNSFCAARPTPEWWRWRTFPRHLLLPSSLDNVRLMDLWTSRPSTTTYLIPLDSTTSWAAFMTVYATLTVPLPRTRRRQNTAATPPRVNGIS